MRRDVPFDACDGGSEGTCILGMFVAERCQSVEVCRGVEVLESRDEGADVSEASLEGIPVVAEEVEGELAAHDSAKNLSPVLHADGGRRRKDVIQQPRQKCLVCARCESRKHGASVGFRSRKLIVLVSKFPVAVVASINSVNEDSALHVWTQDAFIRILWIVDGLPKLEEFRRPLNACNAFHAAGETLDRVGIVPLHDVLVDSRELLQRLERRSGESRFQETQQIRLDQSVPFGRNEHADRIIEMGCSNGPRRVLRLASQESGERQRNVVGCQVSRRHESECVVEELRPIGERKLVRVSLELRCQELPVLEVVVDSAEPRGVGVGIGVAEESFLSYADLAGVVVADRSDEGETGLSGPSGHDLRDGASPEVDSPVLGRCLQVTPQVLLHHVIKARLGKIGRNPIVERFHAAHESFDHFQQTAPFPVRDVKETPDLVEGEYVRDQRVDRLLRVRPEGPQRAQHIRMLRFPCRIRSQHPQIRAVHGETLVEPNHIPPLHRDKVPEEIVCELVRRHGTGVVDPGEVIPLVVDEKSLFLISDQTPVLHRSVQEVWKAYEVHLGHGFVSRKDFFKVKHRKRPVTEHELTVFDDIRPGIHPKRRRTVGGQSAELRDREADRIGRHRDRLLEHVQERPILVQQRLLERHVRERHPILLPSDRDVESCLEVGFVEAGERQPRV
ncbi:unnamed protein product [Darwinula stevensoni]|uniref:Uncharacterized protein n=1 Tax=Darwinula stevensoni TaxID=69355 RepID=A0A7R9FPR4_9CRUS|nr:unnamed protein product [Darwinula stevensoni]CAG0897987.1 unnamed protein product [Darwinula stevensoni]